MERLSGLDAGFLYMETPNAHMHTLKIAVIDPSDSTPRYSFQAVKDVLASRIHLLPPFRRRIVEVPWRLHHPVWIEDPNFDIDYHVRRVGCPAPGGPREFCEMISDVASRPLDREHPLWEIWVVEGLEDGRVGFVAKMHHTIADGLAAAALLANVMQTVPEQPSETSPWKPEAIPSNKTLLFDAVADIGKDLRDLPNLLKRTFEAMTALRRNRRDAVVKTPLPFSTAKTSFNAALTPHRTFAMTTLSLADVKAVRSAFGVTVNDVVLAVCAGALRRYLTDRAELPSKPLVAGVPTSTSTEPRLGGNRVSNMFVTLRTDLDDPIARLKEIQAQTKAAKVVHNILGTEMLADWSQQTPPRPFAWFMRLYSRRGWASRHRPPINLVVSNVPGPPQPLEIVGARLETLSSVGPILEGIGLNITVWSYVGAMNFGIVACREHMPDIWSLADALRDSLVELRKAAEQPRAS
ncbi:MAG TPA: wax ester/triacylglycerol synthase family O-acyltransferase [Actinomycetota bacterium]|nr:wax ester/triacylglycerol synthase family O-acyltransferase [Actinomycetota bacterium]